MTYEQAVARAFLNARQIYKWASLKAGTYALRRLRVRAGLMP